MRLGLAAGLCLAISLSGAAAGQAPDPAPPEPGSVSYSTTGPGILRTSDRRSLSLAVPGPQPDESGLQWTSILALTPEAFAQGWRLSQPLCDSQTTNACVVERRREGLSEWALVDLARPGEARWSPSEAGRLVDYDARSRSVLRLMPSSDGRVSLTLSPLGMETPGREIWTADAANANATARFLRGQDGGRSILLVIGGPGVQWRIVGSDRTSPVRSAPGVPTAAFADAVYFLAESPDRSESVFGSVALPSAGSDWGADAALYRGGPTTPAIISSAIPGDLWPQQRSAAFLPNGDLLAVTRDAGRLELAEICRPSPDAPVTARGVSATSGWLEDAAQAAIWGGAPSSRTILVSRKDLGGQTTLKAIFLAGPDGPGEAIRLCGETPIATIELPLPTVDAPPDLALTAHSVQASDGARLEYDVIRSGGRVGQILIRPYGAYGMEPDAFLARPIERRWVAEGNTLVIPRLRGDAGPQAWIDAGRGDYKRQSSADLATVTRDILARTPSVRRVSLLGISAGGFVAAKAALGDPALFDHVVLVSGVSDLELSEARSPDSFDRAEFGAPEGGFSTWLGGQPAVTPAPQFVILHGDGDTVVPVEASTRLAGYIRGLGYAVRGQRYQGVGHELADAPYIFQDIKDLW